MFRLKAEVDFGSQPHQSVRETVQGEKNFNQDLAGKLNSVGGKVQFELHLISQALVLLVLGTFAQLYFFHRQLVFCGLN